jgi:serine-type D-Ala-D-Ala carboxypeptidase (penicillin-binding protein 5/6)
MDPDTVYTARPSDVAAEGGHVGIVVGGTYTVTDLFNAMLLPSGNDAANAVAHANGGLRRTVAQMNDQALRLQANDTVARNPSGLDAPHQVSSPYDLALIARAGLAREDFSAYVSRISADFPGLMPKKPGKKRQTFKIYTQNRLLLNGFRGAIGVKTGYTTNAGRTFVGAARRDGRTLIVALMQITDWTETASSNALEWGFANADHLTPVGSLVDPLDDAAFAAAMTARGSGPADDDGTGQAATAARRHRSGGASASTPIAAVDGATGTTSVDPVDRVGPSVLVAALAGLAVLGVIAMAVGAVLARGRGAARGPSGNGGPRGRSGSAAEPELPARAPDAIDPVLVQRE